MARWRCRLLLSRGGGKQGPTRSKFTKTHGDILRSAERPMLTRIYIERKWEAREVGQPNTTSTNTRCRARQCLAQKTRDITLHQDSQSAPLSVCNVVGQGNLTSADAKLLLQSKLQHRALRQHRRRRLSTTTPSSSTSRRRRPKLPRAPPPRAKSACGACAPCWGRRTSASKSLSATGARIGPRRSSPRW